MVKINLYYFSKSSFEHEGTKENLRRNFVSSCSKYYKLILITYLLEMCEDC